MTMIRGNPTFVALLAALCCLRPAVAAPDEEALGKACPGKRSGNQNTIVAGQHTREMLAVTFRQRPRHLLPSPASCPPAMITLFGSGFAGFG